MKCLNSPYLQSFLNFRDHFLKSDKHILDVPASGRRHELQMVNFVYPDYKVLIVVDKITFTRHNT